MAGPGDGLGFGKGKKAKGKKFNANSSTPPAEKASADTEKTVYRIAKPKEKGNPPASMASGVKKRSLEDYSDAELKTAKESAQFVAGYRSKADANGIKGKDVNYDKAASAAAKTNMGGTPSKEESRAVEARERIRSVDAEAVRRKRKASKQ